MRKILLAFVFVGAALAPIGGLYAWVEYSLPEYANNQLNDRSLYVSTDAKVSIIRNGDRQGRRESVLLEGWGFIYFIDIGGELVPQIIPVSQRFVTDFASIPKPLSWLISPFGEHAEAAILHDWLYAVGESVGDRKSADVAFYIAMKRSGVPKWRRNLMYAATRLGGNSAFGRREEWSENFYEPIVSSRLPASCLPERPNGPWIDTDPITIRSPLDQRRLDQQALRIRSSMDFYAQSTSFYNSAWKSLFESEGCQIFLLSNMRKRIRDELFAQGADSSVDDAFVDELVESKIREVLATKDTLSEETILLQVQN
ncbi:MAG: DUF1353 domain-containing protein [Parvularcula sp.]|nr:DUF1353 domain-containing protein [Parvularcula sp.]